MAAVPLFLKDNFGLIRPNFVTFVSQKMDWK
jgi:hypothetical protein